MSGSKIRMDSDGGYTGIVIKIKDDGSVPEDECPKILANLQVRLLRLNLYKIYIYAAFRTTELCFDRNFSVNIHETFSLAIKPRESPT